MTVQRHEGWVVESIRGSGKGTGQGNKRFSVLLKFLCGGEQDGDVVLGCRACHVGKCGTAWRTDVNLFTGAKKTKRLVSRPRCDGSADNCTLHVYAQVLFKVGSYAFIYHSKFPRAEYN